MTSDSVNLRAAALLNECGFLQVMKTAFLPEGHYVAMRGDHLVASGPWPPASLPDGVTDIFVPPDVLRVASERFGR